MKLVDQLNAIDAWHANVGNDGIKALTGERIQGFFAIGGFGDRATEIAKPCGENLAHVRFIISN